MCKSQNNNRPAHPDPAPSLLFCVACFTSSGSLVLSPQRVQPPRVWQGRIQILAVSAKSARPWGRYPAACLCQWRSREVLWVCKRVSLHWRIREHTPGLPVRAVWWQQEPRAWRGRCGMGRSGEALGTVLGPAWPRSWPGVALSCPARSANRHVWAQVLPTSVPCANSEERTHRIPART